MTDAEVSTAGEGLEDLLAFIRDARGFDFAGYKRTSLTRRIRKRMQDAGASSYRDYRDHLETHADEFSQLFNTILINATGFFRDAEAWETVRTEVVKPLLESVDDHQEVRVWSAGCSTGEEPYSLAMLFAEAMGLDAFSSRIKVYATDVDEEALAVARRGYYPTKEVEQVPEDLRAKYFEAGPVGMAFNPDLRRQVIFGRLDLTRDAPISRLDLLVCRNTLMYFNAETQTQILGRFHFALRESGYLFLGKAEMLMSNGTRFVPVNLPYRIFRRASSRLAPAAAPLDLAALANVQLFRHRQLRDHAINAGSSALLVIDVEGNVAMVNGPARNMFGLTRRDEGRPLRDLELSYRPVELRSLIEQAEAERRTVRVNAVERRISGGEVQYLDVQVQPFVGDDGVLLGSAIVFTDATPLVRLQQELKGSREELETAYEELQSTNEELETLNEELQSSIEELETTNEELQSTNEELETTNEELQSTNEELETMNEELRVRTNELDDTNSFLETVLSSVPSGVVVLDETLRVSSWNSAAEEMWGLRADEVLGAPFFSLDFGLPTGELRDPVRASLERRSTQEKVAIEAVNRLGQSITTLITCSSLRGSGTGVVMLMESERSDRAD
jgi:two-component system CheB/CheR fusion protein